MPTYLDLPNPPPPHLLSPEISRTLYFDLTREFNAPGTIAVLASGQAAVFHRIAIMSKDGDWIIRETPEACQRILSVLAEHGARYRLSAPLDPRWLAGGWSSHFSYDIAIPGSPYPYAVKCDFVGHPPRIADPTELFRSHAGEANMPVVTHEQLILLKRTDRRKDYVVIGEAARQLPAHREIEFSLDPDRIIELAPTYGTASTRPCVRAALRGEDRRTIRIAIDDEIDQFMQANIARMRPYREAASTYAREFIKARIHTLPLLEGHALAVAIAKRWLPPNPTQN